MCLLMYAMYVSLTHNKDYLLTYLLTYNLMWTISSPSVCVFVVPSIVINAALRVVKCIQM